MNLQQLIDQHRFDYVNSNITETNFPLQEVGDKFELFKIKKAMTTSEILKAMDKKGLRPANLYELLSWKDWNGKDWIVALGSGWVRPGGSRYVPCLGEGGSGRGLRLGWGGPGREWVGNFRFLALSKSSVIGALSPGHSDPSVAQESVLGRLENLEKRVLDLETWRKS